ncbi:hypothetical protein, partial [Calditerricola satsumensis]|uniref:hypothetical protein n=1 Tax=Calditerricola satsumensis TaxID=373054 RepID=UPI001C468F7F
APRVAALPENGSVRYYVWTGNDTTPEAHQKTGVVLEQLVPERSFEPVDVLLKRVFPNGSPRYVLIDWPGGAVACGRRQTRWCASFQSQAAACRLQRLRRRGAAPTAARWKCAWLTGNWP